MLMGAGVVQGARIDPFSMYPRASQYSCPQWLINLGCSDRCCSNLLTRFTHSVSDSFHEFGLEVPTWLLCFLNGIGWRPWSNQRLLAWKFDVQTQYRSAHTESCLLGRGTPVLADAHLCDQGVIQDPIWPAVTYALDSINYWAAWLDYRPDSILLQ